MNEELERLAARKAQLEAKLKRLKVQQRHQERKDDARRKILMGGALAAAVRAEMVSEGLLFRILDTFVTKEKDRAFLGLPPREKDQGKEEADAQGEGVVENDEPSNYEE